MTQLLPDIRFGVVRGQTFGIYGKPDVFVPQARALGARTVRVSLFWSQIEPEPGRFVWDEVDALLQQLEDDDEAWVTVISSSPWATRIPSRVLPGSPARDLAEYQRFVDELVTHCQGRVRFWQCDNEPCIEFVWEGTAPQYLAQLEVFSRTVKAADPTALVVLGGAPPDALIFEGLVEDDEAVDFFEHVIAEGGEHFDVFDIHLYGNPYVIAGSIEASRLLLAKHGLDKPIVVGEYNGPLPYDFPELAPRLSILMAGLHEPAVDPSANGQLSLAEAQGPDEPGMVKLYERMAKMPPLLQMFMTGCPAELEAKRHRWHCRDLVMRNMIALSTGVRRILCYGLAPDAAEPVSPYHLMELLFSKFKLMDYTGEQISHRYPAANALALLTSQLDGVQEVRRIEVEAQPMLYVFEARRSDRGPLLVVWERRDDFDGEDKPATAFDWEWPAAEAHAIDALGTTIPAEVHAGRVHLPISVNPVFIQ